MTDAPASTTRGEVAGQAETSNDNYVAPGQQPGQAFPDNLPLEQQVEVLTEFLQDRFPNEIGTNGSEGAVEVAIRLLTGLHAHQATKVVQERCKSEYCNKPLGHKDSHGWVHYG